MKLVKWINTQDYTRITQESCVLKNKIMSDYNLGSEWFWKCILFLAAVGLIAGVIWAVKGIIWLIHHVHIR